MDFAGTVALVLGVSSAAAVVTRLLVSMYLIQQDVPRVVGATAGVLIGIAASLLYILAGGGHISVQSAAVSILAGIIAAAESEGIHVAQSAAHEAVRMRAVDGPP